MERYERYLLILLAVLLAGSIGVFFLYVAILPVLGVVALVIGLAAMFCLGFYVGQDPSAVADYRLTSGWLLAQLNAILSDKDKSATVP